MKLYIVTETYCSSNNLSRSWVCFTEDQAKECLKKRFDFACLSNRIGGIPEPIDCTEDGFFFWKMAEDLELRYDIKTSQTFAE